jgi:hypothetical protein
LLTLKDHGFGKIPSIVTNDEIPAIVTYKGPWCLLNPRYRGL